MTSSITPTSQKYNKQNTIPTQSTQFTQQNQNSQTLKHTQQQYSSLQLSEYIPNIQRPTHQGRAFKIDLGHNIGPYLSKDVMHSNQKSTYLIAAKQVLQSHMSMSNMMNVLNKQVQNQSKTIKNSFKVQNWFSKCQFIQGQLTYLDNQSKKLSIETKKLRAQIKNSYRKLVHENQELSQNFLPLFKNLLKSIREQSSGQKNIYQQRKRDLQELTKFRNSYLDQLVLCQKRIIKVQQFLGIGENQHQ